MPERPGTNPDIPRAPNGRFVVGTVPAPGKSFAWVNGLSGGGMNLELVRGADGSLVVKCS